MSEPKHSDPVRCKTCGGFVPCYWHNRALSGWPPPDAPSPGKAGAFEESEENVEALAAFMFHDALDTDSIGPERLWANCTDPWRSKWREHAKAVLAWARARSRAAEPKGDTRSGCPCTLTEPCSYACSCANQFMSGGCSRCARYGSEEQRKAMAEEIARRIPREWAPGEKRPEPKGAGGEGASGEPSEAEVEAGAEAMHDSDEIDFMAPTHRRVWEQASDYAREKYTRRTRAALSAARRCAAPPDLARAVEEARVALGGAKEALRVCCLRLDQLKEPRSTATELSATDRAEQAWKDAAAALAALDSARARGASPNDNSLGCPSGQGPDCKPGHAGSTPAPSSNPPEDA